MHCTANGVQRASFHASLTSLGCLHEPPLLLNAADSDSFLRLIESIVCTDHSSLCPLLRLCALGLTPRLRFCELRYVAERTNISSSPRLVLLGMLTSVRDHMASAC